MEKKHWWHYLLPRSFALCACQAVCTLAVLLALGLYARSRAVVVGALLACLIFLLFQLAWWKWIYLPYRKMEKEGTKFLDGYMPEGELVAAASQFSLRHIAVQKFGALFFHFAVRQVDPFPPGQLKQQKNQPRQQCANQNRPAPGIQHQHQQHRQRTRRLAGAQHKGAGKQVMPPVFFLHGIAPLTVELPVLGGVQSRGLPEGLDKVLDIRVAHLPADLRHGIVGFLQ